MRKFIICFLLFSLFLGKAFSQEDYNSRLVTNQVSFSVGTVSAVGLFGGLFFPVPDSVKNNSKENIKPFEAYSVSIGYDLILLDFLGLGLFANYDKFGKFEAVSGQAKLTIQYGPRMVKFYHSISGGALIVPHAAMMPIFDVTVLGIKLLLDDFSVFLEASAPSTGLLKVGAAYNF